MNCISTLKVMLHGMLTIPFLWKMVFSQWPAVKEALSPGECMNWQDKSNICSPAVHKGDTGCHQGDVMRSFPWKRLVLGNIGLDQKPNENKRIIRNGDTLIFYLLVKPRFPRSFKWCKSLQGSDIIKTGKAEICGGGADNGQTGYSISSGYGKWKTNESQHG